jgi:PAS domain S-box-containing protein
MKPKGGASKKDGAGAFAAPAAAEGEGAYGAGGGARATVEEILRERERLAALSAEVSTALARSETLSEMLRRCAEAMVKHLDAAFARVWTLDEAENVLELQASAGLYTHLDGPHSRVPVGKFKIGLIAEERRPHLTNDVPHDPRVGDKEWAAREGMVAFAGYPLLLGERLVGVMAMFSRSALSEVTLQAMASVADGIAVGIERKQSEAELRASELRYRALTDAMPQLVWASDENGAHFFYNRRWYEYTGLSEEESLGFGFTNALHPEDKARTLAAWERAWRAGEGYEIEYRFYSRPLGAYRWFLGRAVPVRDEAGRVAQWVGTCTDIEEQKQMEAQLARLNEERERMIEEVSTPVVPVLEGVLVLPIIGSLDTVRMERATTAALSEVTRTGARVCIIDITGARIIDSHAVANLSNLVQAIRLVGAEAVVTGVGVHAAQSLVGLGLDLQGMRTHRTLAEALARLIKRGRA